MLLALHAARPPRCFARAARAPIQSACCMSLQTPHILFCHPCMHCVLPRHAALHAAGSPGLAVPTVKVPARLHIRCAAVSQGQHACLAICLSSARAAQLRWRECTCTDALGLVADAALCRARCCCHRPLHAIAALLYVTSTLTLPNAIFTFLAFPEEATKYGACGGCGASRVLAVDAAAAACTMRIAACMHPVRNAQWHARAWSRRAALMACPLLCYA